MDRVKKKQKPSEQYNFGRNWSAEREREKKWWVNEEQEICDHQLRKVENEEGQTGVKSVGSSPP